MLDQFVIESEWYKLILERGEHRLAQRALERRHGALSAEVLQALGQADEVILEDLVVNAATDTIEQVRERLGLTQP